MKKKNPKAVFMSAEFHVELVNSVTCVTWGMEHPKGLWNITMRRHVCHPRFIKVKLSPTMRNALKIVEKYRMEEFV